MRELWVDKRDFRNTRAVQINQPNLEQGEIRVAIDKFAVTSNNVGYAVSGEQIGYWKYFPTGEDNWGKVTVWGMADVVESNSPDIDMGERLYGFFPMSSHLIMTPGRVTDKKFVDMTSHRQELPALYNQYSRTRSESMALQTIEDQRCVLFPLFMTGYVIADFLLDNQWFDAQQVIIGSASSKTGIGSAKFIKENDFQGQLIGLTSSSNKAFVQNLGICDQVIAYDEVESLANHPSVFVDMSGDGSTRARLHHHLGEDMKNSQLVGVTHWDAQKVVEKLPGAKPSFFFTPAQIEKRDADWGAGVLMQKGYAASAELAMQLKDQLTMEHHQGTDACATIWRSMLDNKITGQQGTMVSLRSSGES